MTYQELAKLQLQSISDTVQDNSVKCGNLEIIVKETKKQLPQLDENLYLKALLGERNNFPNLCGLKTTEEYLNNTANE